MRIFLDANILFSASLPGSRLAGFLRELRQHANLVTNRYAEAEAERNIAAKHPRQSAALAKFTMSLGMIPMEKFQLDVEIAEKDALILCGAVSGKADFLLTGDKKDFGHLFGTTVRGVKIVSVQLLLSELISRKVLSESF